MTVVQLLHLSDLHFGVIRKEGHNPRSAHWFTPAGKLQADPSQLARLLTTKERIAAPPDFIVASGDIGWSGVADDYTPALEFFRLLKTAFPKTRLVVAPGNHDVNRGDIAGDTRQSAFREFLQQLHKSDGLKQHYPLLDAPGSPRDNLIAVERYPDDDRTTCVVVAFNSAAGLQNDKTPVRIDPSALERLDDHLKNLTIPIPDEALRICVLHHHLFPFAEAPWEPTGDARMAFEMKADPDLLANSAKLQGWLAQRGFHLVLHGHKHTSHGRDDLLWRRNDRSGRRLLIIGAGSAGVEQGHRSNMEPLSFNEVTATRVSRKRWQIDTAVREIAVDLAVPEARPFYRYRAVAGLEHVEDQAPPVYQAEQMDDCHRAIALATRDTGVQHNFLSIVDDPAYVHPDTARFKGEPVDLTRIHNCFRMLHPEHDKETGWDDLARYDQRLEAAQLRGRFQFEHGSRMFRSPDRRVRRDADDVWRTSPLLRVIDALRHDPNSGKAYTSLFRPDIDVLSPGSEPLPGLMSLHFLKRQERLDVTVTFRKVELSFWWCVNMYEVSLLLHWVCDRLKVKPGRISFFAALAQWKDDPEAPVEAALDTTSLSTLTGWVFRDDWRTLAEMLAEKERLINENNLDTSGLERLAELLAAREGCIDDTAKRARLECLRGQVDAARNLIEQAKHAPQTNGPHHLRRAVSELQSAHRTLEDLTAHADRSS